jgi:hypothetical protein
MQASATVTTRPTACYGGTTYPCDAARYVVNAPIRYYLERLAGESHAAEG